MEDLLERVGVDEVQRFWELYVSDCDSRGLTPVLSDFGRWYEEEYATEYA